MPPSETRPNITAPAPSLKYIEVSGLDFSQKGVCNSTPTTKAYLIELWENSVKVADKQLKGINLISESDVEVLPNNTPTEEEMKADEKALAEKQADKIQEEAK